MDAHTHRPSAAPRLDPDPRAWRRLLVYGLGASGRAAIDAIRARSGAAVVGVDDCRPRDLRPPEGVALWTTAELDALPDGTDAVVVSPGVPLDRPLLAAARAAGCPIVAEIELGQLLLDDARRASGLDHALVAVTGSNGKSTVTALTAALLQATGRDAVACGNFGPPLTAALPPIDAAAPRTLVVEVSSFQLETVDRFHPSVAALLNLSPDHLDRHGSFDRYADAKLRLFARQTTDDVAVVNADDTGDAVAPAHRLEAMRQAAERAHAADARVARRAGGARQERRGEGVGGVDAAGQIEIVAPEERLLRAAVDLDRQRRQLGVGIFREGRAVEARGGGGRPIEREAPDARRPPPRRDPAP
ncbi:MAG: Mur ligase family protein [Acidobacteriota bacterium]